MSLADIPACASDGGELCPDCGDRMADGSHESCDPLALVRLARSLPRMLDAARVPA